MSLYKKLSEQRIAEKEAQEQLEKANTFLAFLRWEGCSEKALADAMLNAWAAKEQYIEVVARH